jgi:transposase
MNVLHPRGAGLDLAKDSLVAGVRLQDGSVVKQECRSFGTTTRELLDLLGWLDSHGVTQVVMEATGSYWKAVWHVLEADLLAHGLIRGSFVPPAPVQELRDLTRTRKQLTREIVQHTQRIQKTLDTANVKIVGVVSDILGVSGRAILKALIQGESSPDRLADLARGSLKLKRSELVEALHGHVLAHHRRLLKLHLGIIEKLEEQIAELDRYLGEALRPFRDSVERLKTIPGVADLTAQTILAEIGFDMARFPNARHLVSWACLCPRLDMSAGKHHSTRTRKGGNWLKTVLVQAAWAAVRKRDENYLRAQFFRLRARRGPKKAIMAVAASMLTAAFHILRDGSTYTDLGADYLDRLDRAKLAHRLLQRLTRLGFQVQLQEAVA